MSQLFGMWALSPRPKYQGLQRMSDFWFFRSWTALLYEAFVTAPLTLSSAAVTNLPTMKPIWPKLWIGTFFAYFAVIARYSVMSGPVSVSRPNSELTKR